ncbi:hypothetical protein HZH68_002202 [Vespula germanica]|uniref:Uncharacterized protein n=1 Tax=Vespula germanica TaxID=30212 RepID=A0A834KVH3_VESGE|nr:hypothetical protein HZH68_002202 [Vespula germanica]
MSWLVLWETGTAESPPLCLVSVTKGAAEDSTKSFPSLSVYHDAAMQPERGHLRSLVVRDAFCRTTAIQCQVSTSGKRRPVNVGTTYENFVFDYPPTQQPPDFIHPLSREIRQSFSIRRMEDETSYPVDRNHRGSCSKGVGISFLRCLRNTVELKFHLRCWRIGPIGKFHRCDMTADTLDHSDNMREGQGKGSSLREIGLEDEKFKKTIRP